MDIRRHTVSAVLGVVPWVEGGIGSFGGCVMSPFGTLYIIMGSGM